ncbi:MAG: hypothetical protein HQ559_08095 [Lentisphaerae bacterium]|nr:hypothetical protein [Lentisphaerota bacterium]
MKHGTFILPVALGATLTLLLVCGCGRPPEKPLPVEKPGPAPETAITPSPEVQPSTPEPATPAAAAEEEPGTGETSYEQALAAVIELEEEARFSEALTAIGDMLQQYTKDEQREPLRRLEYRLKIEKRDAAGIPRMLERLASDDERMVQLARQRIERAGKAGTIHLRKAVRESPPEIAAASALVLLDLRDDEALEPIAERLRGTDDEQLVAVLTDTLKQLRVSDVQSRLLKATEDASGSAKDALFDEIYAHVRARNNRYLSLAAEINGRVSDNTGWHPIYTNVTIEAFPVEGYRFLQWMGDVPTNDVQTNPLVVEMDLARTVSARFVRNAGQYRTWNTNAGGWHTAAAWTPQGVPGPLDTVRITNGQVTVKQALASDMLLVENARLEFQGWGTVHKVQNTVVLRDGAVLTHSRNAKEPAHRLNLSCRKLTLSTGAVITAVAAGFKGELGKGPGPGGGATDKGYGGGGAHGGAGGNSIADRARGGTNYNQVAQPAHLGSAGGGNGSHARGGSGGGMIVLDVARSLELDGLLAADGVGPGGHPSYIPNAGGGAGGSIVIHTPRLTGAGAIRADGGPGGSNGGGGGGGRIALHLENASGFTGVLSAGAGKGHSEGGLGTVYVTDPRVVDSASFTGGGARFRVKGKTWDIDELSLSGYDLGVEEGAKTRVTGSVFVREGSRLRVAGSGTFSCRDMLIAGSSNRASVLDLGAGREEIAASMLECSGNFTATNHAAVNYYPGAALKVGGLLRLDDESHLYSYCHPTSGVPPGVMHLDSLDLAAGCTIDASQRGYRGSAADGAGPGGGKQHSYGGGGGHGGTGADGYAIQAPGGRKYGDPRSPATAGSAGGGNNAVGYGGHGGGVIRMIVDETARIDGEILAEGGPSWGHVHQRMNTGGGAGGSIAIACAALQGKGVMKANGGDGGTSGGGGGAGGRIAVNSGDGEAFRGGMTARGGGGRNSGEPGTICLSGSDILRSMDLSSGGGVLYGPGDPWQLDDLRLSDYAMRLSSGSDMRVKGAVTLDDGSRLAMEEGVRLECADVFVTGTTNRASRIELGGNPQAVYGNSLTCAGAVVLATNASISLYAGSGFAAEALTLRDDSHLYAWCHPTSGVPPGPIVADAVMIGKGCTLDAEGKGYAGTTTGGQGPGGGFGPSYGGGGGHGAPGANAKAGTGRGGAAYGDAKMPSLPGSSGTGFSSVRGGAGGGVLVVKARSVTVNGRISASGKAALPYSNQHLYAGGGAGGSVRISCDTLTGTGVISADGADGGVTAGGGGGGRVALRVTKPSRFGGRVSSGEGRGGRTAEPGTVYVSRSVILPSVWRGGGGTLLFEGRTWNPPSLSVSNATLVLSPGLAVTVEGDIQLLTNATVRIERGASLEGKRHCALKSGTLRRSPGSKFKIRGTLALSGHATLHEQCDPETGAPPGPIVAGHVRIGKGCTISADAGGYRGGTNGTDGLGAGGGKYGGYAGGGGYGGAGGAGHAGTAGGGGTYGSAEKPSDCGSGGGAAGARHGCRGGGLLRMVAKGKIVCDGAITANGAGNYNPGYSGCGSGGTIRIRCAEFAGAASGRLSANGGSSAHRKLGGPGGGGRIAVTCKTRTFKGTAEAAPGTGPNPGQPGTVHWDVPAGP